MSIKQIYILQKQIELEWEEMQKETNFIYDDPSSMLQKEKDNKNRLPDDLNFWKKLDDFVLDITKPKFPRTIFSTYKFFGDPDATRMMNEIDTQKGILAKRIDDYNKRNQPGIQDKNDILRIINENADKETLTSERISQAKAAVKQNTVVILVLCHGAYEVNDNLTIDKIPFPENKLGEIVKKSVFGRSTLSDFDYDSRNPGDGTTTRYPENVIKKKLKDAYETVLTDTTSLINPTQQALRKVITKYMFENKEAYCKAYGLVDDSCIHVGFEFSHIPLLRKIYTLDRLSSKSAYRRAEFSRGIIVMFQNDRGNLVQRNLNRLYDFLWLQEKGYINLPFRVEEVVDYWGTPDRDLDTNQVIYDDTLDLSQVLIRQIGTDFLMRIIESFPEKYKYFKIVDNSCGVLHNYSKVLTEEEKETVFKRYSADMQCNTPEESKGGRKRRKTKTFKLKKRKTKCIR
jgi:hypothetical protein